MPTANRDEATALAKRVHEFRVERNLTISGLAAAAKLSKSFIWAIENGDAPRPSGRTLYAIAEALGVTMSDLLGRQLLTDSEEERPPSLQEFASEHHLPEADIRMLASIRFRGGQPTSKERWAHIYSSIRGTEWMDQAAPEESS